MTPPPDAARRTEEAREAIHDDSAYDTLRAYIDLVKTPKIEELTAKAREWWLAKKDMICGSGQMHLVLWAKFALDQIDRATNHAINKWLADRRASDAAPAAAREAERCPRCQSPKREERLRTDSEPPCPDPWHGQEGARGTTEAYRPKAGDVVWWPHREGNVWTVHEDYVSSTGPGNVSVLFRDLRQTDRAVMRLATTAERIAAGIDKPEAATKPSEAGESANKGAEGGEVESMARALRASLHGKSAWTDHPVRGVEWDEMNDLDREDYRIIARAVFARIAQAEDEAERRGWERGSKATWKAMDVAMLASLPKYEKGSS